MCVAMVGQLYPSAIRSIIDLQNLVPMPRGITYTCYRYLATNFIQQCSRTYNSCFKTGVGTQEDEDALPHRLLEPSEYKPLLSDATMHEQYST